MNRGNANKLINERKRKNGKVGDIILTKVRDPRSEYLSKLFIEMVRKRYNIKIKNHGSSL